VTVGGYALLPNGDNLDPPPKNERPQPLIEKTAVVTKMTRRDAVSVLGWMASRWAVLYAAESCCCVDAGRAE